MIPGLSRTIQSGKERNLKAELGALTPHCQGTGGSGPRGRRGNPVCSQDAGDKMRLDENLIKTEKVNLQPTKATWDLFSTVIKAGAGLSP